MESAGILFDKFLQFELIRPMMLEKDFLHICVYMHLSIEVCVCVCVCVVCVVCVCGVWCVCGAGVVCVGRVRLLNF